MIKPAKPNPIAAMLSLQELFPSHPRAVALALKSANAELQLIPPWREIQTLNFLKFLNIYAEDLYPQYVARRCDQLGETVRKLIEISIWIQFCCSDEKRARTFYEDSARDIVGQMRALQEMYTFENGHPDPELTKLIEGLRSSAVKDGYTDVDGKFINVRDAAEEIGKGNVFRGLFKVCSKLAHPTAMVLNHDNQLAYLCDSLYVGGEFYCRRGVEELETFIRKFFRTTIIRT